MGRGNGAGCGGEYGGAAGRGSKLATGCSGTAAAPSLIAIVSVGCIGVVCEVSDASAGGSAGAASQSLLDGRDLANLLDRRACPVAVVRQVGCGDCVDLGRRRGHCRRWRHLGHARTLVCRARSDLDTRRRHRAGTPASGAGPYDERDGRSRRGRLAAGWLGGPRGRQGRPRPIRDRAPDRPPRPRPSSVSFARCTGPLKKGAPAACRQRPVHRHWPHMGTA